MKKIVFFDRDGVINKKAAEHCYITKTADFIFNPGIFKLMRKLKRLNFEFIIISNQRGIARGIFSEDDLAHIHDFMLKEFKRRQIKILDIFYCPHEHDSCQCRKPRPGMLIEATNKYRINLTSSILISDDLKDINMGKKYGIGKNFLINTDRPESLIDKI